MEHNRIIQLLQQEIQNCKEGARTCRNCSVTAESSRVCDSLAAGARRIRLMAKARAQLKIYKIAKVGIKEKNQQENAEVSLGLLQRNKRARIEMEKDIA
ncbi:hypothetical protein TNCV_910531 [Trichonephila clavipes]|uniref:Uncharacterized protein n=1 Tax=Trichonephila clavipes TaxID=2585209 RepID=A0A8X7BEL0_TRICX|nr:hypothetical protein TNCV_910531 [Trichonephila clavipes]